MTTKAELLLRHFLARQDRFFVLAAWNKHCTAVADDVLAVLATHTDGELAPEAKLTIKAEKYDSTTLGRFRVATPSVDADGLARWVCIDFDGAPLEKGEDDHANPLADPEAAAWACWARLAELGIPSYVERSGGGFGWHVWVLLERPAPLADARALGLGAAPAVKLRSGGVADPVAGLGVEVFPKGFTAVRGSTGAPIWLPWYRLKKQPGANEFYDPISRTPWTPTAFTPVDPDQLAKALAQLPPASSYQGARLITPPGAQNRGKQASKGGAPTPTTPQELNAGDWRAWREQVLAAVSLEQVYSPYMTGRHRSHGWLECRDFRSGSGDVKPSAGVADGTGEAQRGSFHSFVRGDTLSLFDYLVEVGAASSFADACKMLADMTGIPMPKTKAKPAPPPPPTPPGAQPPAGGGGAADPRPLIIVSNQQLDSLAGQAWDSVLLVNDPPSVYNKGGAAVRLAFSEVGSLPTIEEIAQDAMMGTLARTARWYKEKGSGKSLKLEAVFPPKQVALDCLAFPDRRLPQIEAVVGCPVFGKDGSLTTKPGYNPGARLWYEVTPGFNLPDLAEAPTQQDAIDAARWLLEELFVDFKFATVADKTAAVGALVLALARRLVKGPTPLYVVEAPSVGAGKGLIIRLICITATGRDATPQPLPVDEEEIRKKLLAELMTGRPIVVLDNADLNKRRIIASGNLEAVLTTEEWTDRALQQSKMVTVQNRAVWFMSGVNLEFSPGLMRRRVRIRIDPKMADPWKRGGWHHEDIIGWTHLNRGEICARVYTMVRAWLAAGKPKGERRLGSYEGWSDTVGGVLLYAGLTGFLGHLNDPDEAATSHETTEWSEFIDAWWENWNEQNPIKGEKPVRTLPQTIGPLNELCDRRDLLTEVRGGGSARSQQVTFARALKGIRGRVFGDKTVMVRQDANTKTLKYWLQVGTVPDSSNAAAGGAVQVGTAETTAQNTGSRDLSGSVQANRSRTVTPWEESDF
jgi:hypothetical protein